MARAVGAKTASARPRVCSTAAASARFITSTSSARARSNRAIAALKAAAVQEDGVLVGPDKVRVLG